MNLDQRLVDAAIEQMDHRARTEAAAVYLHDGRILTSVCLDNLNAAATLYAETGAICQAYTLGASITASVFVSRGEGESGFSGLAPLGSAKNASRCGDRMSRWALRTPKLLPAGAREPSWNSTRSTGASTSPTAAPGLPPLCMPPERWDSGAREIRTSGARRDLSYGSFQDAVVGSLATRIRQ